MKRKMLIENTKTLLKNISIIKERAKNEECTKKEKFIINSLLNALNALNGEEQKIVAYKYFEGKTHQEMSEILHMGKNTVSRRLEKLYLKIGRLVYGFEEEFWNEIDGFRAQENNHDNLYKDITGKVKKEILSEISSLR